MTAPPLFGPLDQHTALRRDRVLWSLASHLECMTIGQLRHEVRAKVNRQDLDALLEDRLVTCTPIPGAGNGVLGWSATDKGRWGAVDWLHRLHTLLDFADEAIASPEFADAAARSDGVVDLDDADDRVIASPTVLRVLISLAKGEPPAHTNGVRRARSAGLADQDGLTPLGRAALIATARGLRHAIPRHLRLPSHLGREELRMLIHLAQAQRTPGARGDASPTAEQRRTLEALVERGAVKVPVHRTTGARRWERAVLTSMGIATLVGETQRLEHAVTAAPTRPTDTEAGPDDPSARSLPIDPELPAVQDPTSIILLARLSRVRTPLEVDELAASVGIPVAAATAAVRSLAARGLVNVFPARVERLGWRAQPSVQAVPLARSVAAASLASLQLDIAAARAVIDDPDKSLRPAASGNADTSRRNLIDDAVLGILEAEPQGCTARELEVRLHPVEAKLRSRLRRLIERGWVADTVDSFGARFYTPTAAGMALLEQERAVLEPLLRRHADPQSAGASPVDGSAALATRSQLLVLGALAPDGTHGPPSTHSLQDIARATSLPLAMVKHAVSALDASGYLRCTTPGDAELLPEGRACLVRTASYLSRTIDGAAPTPMIRPAASARSAPPSARRTRRSSATPDAQIAHAVAERHYLPLLAALRLLAGQPSGVQPSHLQALLAHAPVVAPSNVVALLQDRGWAAPLGDDAAPTGDAAIALTSTGASYLQGELEALQVVLEVAEVLPRPAPAPPRPARAGAFGEPAPHLPRHELLGLSQMATAKGPVRRTTSKQAPPDEEKPSAPGRLLEALVASGYARLLEVDERKAVGGGPGRNLYQLTDAGRERLLQEIRAIRPFLVPLDQPMALAGLGWPSPTNRGATRDDPSAPSSNRRPDDSRSPGTARRVRRSGPPAPRI